MTRCSAHRCWCAFPATICVQSTGEHWTLVEVAREGSVRVFQYRRVEPQEAPAA